MADWIVAGIGHEGYPIMIHGLNPWNFEWQQVDPDPVELPHPAHPLEKHRFWVYEIELQGKSVRFAAGELSVNVWGFYVPGK